MWSDLNDDIFVSMSRDKLVKTQGYDITILLFDLYVWLKFVFFCYPPLQKT